MTHSGAGKPASSPARGPYGETSLDYASFFVAKAAVGGSNSSNYVCKLFSNVFLRYCLHQPTWGRSCPSLMVKQHCTSSCVSGVCVLSPAKMRLGAATSAFVFHFCLRFSEDIAPQGRWKDPQNRVWA